MTTSPDFNSLNAEQLRNLAAQLLAEAVEKDQTIDRQSQQIHNRKLFNDKLNHELATLRRYHFGNSTTNWSTHYGKSYWPILCCTPKQLLEAVEDGF